MAILHCPACASAPFHPTVVPSEPAQLKSTDILMAVVLKPLEPLSLFPCQRQGRDTLSAGVPLLSLTMEDWCSERDVSSHESKTKHS